MICDSHKPLACPAVEALMHLGVLAATPAAAPPVEAAVGHAEQPGAGLHLQLALVDGLVDHELEIDI